MAPQSLCSPQLSIIIPLYNAGDYFDACMQALLAQTLTSLEIIIVNDGSTDPSGQKAHAYAEKYPHIRVIDQQNGGVSRARNAGLTVARGQYVTFPDADDTMQPCMYQTLIDMALRDNLDVVQCNAERWSLAAKKSYPLIPTTRLRTTPVLSGPVWLNKALLTNRYLHVVWAGIYRLSLIRTLQLDFEPGLHHQDIPWTTELMLNVKRVRYTDRILYRYVMHNQSVSHQKRTGQRNVEYQRHYFKIVRMLDEINQRYRARIKLYPAFYRQVTREALTLCHAIRREPEPDAQQTMISELFTQGIHLIMLRNARGLKQWYQLLLWLGRLLWWRQT
ncbi:glycosyltransferase [Erwinia sp. OLTSP20]|uniref:glycosyltransferase n=1 Tax=unclassified Erwinia TaxID=2622719 RepID=UPI000C177430|nr:MULTISPECIES: glycosyltransferase [unclassified Erwinia]PIJ49658.1 glycosyltransferase [Erwinia sp. OAMSP11]PIJ70073.1 glycosyltransferase [Erwinia sp. OLSSP12]PIJ80570.1 glycosyltransferase [Erwinia sp. OLCASP19]PIJ82735.1 glycosyltransferase [Erwinia sp. OLMTSP26]PIJ84812.1 glycosyltransferase [Erwinia sp. OLMDSP33]